MANFLTARGFTWQSIEDRIADRAWSALHDDERLMTFMRGAIFRQHIHVSGVAGRPQPCVLVGVIRPTEEPRMSQVIVGETTIGIMLEFEEFASDQLQAGEPSIASLLSYVRMLVDRRLSNPISGEERVANGASRWTSPGAVPNEIRGSLTNFFVALEVAVSYKVSYPSRENLLAPAPPAP